MNNDNEWQTVVNKSSIKREKNKKKRKEFFKQRDQATKEGKSDEFMDKHKKKRKQKPIKMTKEYIWALKKYPGLGSHNVYI